MQVGIYARHGAIGILLSSAGCSICLLYTSRRRSARFRHGEKVQVEKVGDGKLEVRLSALHHRLKAFVRKAPVRVEEVDFLHDFLVLVEVDGNGRRDDFIALARRPR